MALTDEAILRIKEMILGGQLKPGDRLPREADLAETLGLSRNSLREAVRALALINILDVRQGDGTYVTSLEPHQLLETMSLAVDFMRNRALVELFEVRRLIEPAATALATARMTPEGLSRLRDSLRRMDAAERVEELVEADDEFHGEISAATGNVALAAFLKNLYGRTMRARIWRGLAEEDAVQRTKVSHRAIYNAIASKDSELARAAATMHIAEVEAWFRRLPEVQDGSPMTGANGSDS